mmetsp:Transcript_16491/g.21690  ORF Transcript_16491/g.21690 Transcript_16491/m.21690 type:complete len:136 (+) Transcript_16491:104-511(+)
MMKKILFLLFACLATSSMGRVANPTKDFHDVMNGRELEVSCDNTCDKKVLSDSSCTGFKRSKDSIWDDYPEKNETGNDCTYQCCTDDEGECCEDYPTGYFVGFIIGCVGMVTLCVGAAYMCATAESTKVDEENLN